MTGDVRTISERLGLGLELFPYQADGVRAIVKRFKGRALLADEMGLGKSAQALATAAAYRTWPLIIVCPASLRLNWRREIEMWLPVIAPIDICVVKTAKDKLYGKAMVFSYEMATTRVREIIALRPGIVVLDEAHYIKNKDTARTKKLIPLCRSAARCVLCTGTPILNRPIELWTQLEALGFSFGKYWDFARRYCDLKKGRFGWDASGARNLGELNQRLVSTCMVRRLKRNVLKDLPPKRRVKIVVEGIGRSNDLDELRAECAVALKKCAGDFRSAMEEMRRRKVTLSGIIFKAYAAVGELKADYAADWAIDNSAPASPLVLFAHHKNVMNRIGARFKEAGVMYGRIDGSTSLEGRQRVVDEFQAGRSQVALLSITAASTGLTLTRSSDMLIAELPFGPGLAAQAEDRIHRVGQQNAALIRYLIAEKTLDDSLWGLINKKAGIAGAAIDGCGQSAFGNAETESAGDYWVVVEEMMRELAGGGQLKLGATA